MIVLGMDPSMSNFGFVKGHLDINDGVFTPKSMCLQKTKPTTIKSTRKNSDDLNRCRSLCDELRRQLVGVELVFCEVPHGSQSARAMASYGMCIGLISGVDAPLIQLTADEVKLGSCGIKNASKQEMVKWAVETHPELIWRKGKAIMGEYSNDNEHLADALATIYAGQASQDFINALALRKAMAA